jgi:hypothetical protein
MAGESQGHMSVTTHEKIRAFYSSTSSLLFFSCDSSTLIFVARNGGVDVNIYYSADLTAARRRSQIYRGDVMILPAGPATLALTEFARSLVEEAFAPLDPRLAHRKLETKEAVEILTRLKPHFIHHPRTRALMQQVLLDAGCAPDLTYQDVPRLRVAYPTDYLSSGIAYAHHPHRDTWYSAPPCQLNWWMPIYDFESNQGMAFHPAYWGRRIDNGSADFDYYRWNADGRKNAGQHIKSDTRQQPRAREEVEIDPDVRLVVPSGGIIVFSADHLHSTVPNGTEVARWSIDFRTVDLDDLTNRRGAPYADAACTGTSLRDFRRLKDGEAMPEHPIAMYDKGGDSKGVQVYLPETAV